MSNVLIGIIGVILFIGLALAGALFLGPRFQDASNSSKAAAMASELRQVASAASLRELDLGRQIAKGVDLVANNTIESAYMKAVSPEIRVYSWEGTNKGVAYRLLPVGVEGDRLCEQLQRQSGQIASSQQPNLGSEKTGISPDTPAVSVGCIRNGEIPSQLAAFARF